MEPSRWRCSSAFGRETIRSESKGGVIRERLVWQLRAAGVFPRREPERADVRCSIGELANQNRRGLIVKAVVILVIEGILAAARVAVSEKNGLQPAIRAEAGLESAIRGVVDENGVVRSHREKRGITVDQRGPEAFVDTRLRTWAAVEIIRRVKGIVRLRHV